MNRGNIAVLLTLIALGGCALGTKRESNAFLASLRPLCGQAFAGVIVDNSPQQANDVFVGKPLVIHFRDCENGLMRIPLHVGEDRSRTWILSADGQSLTLKHDHRHADGSPDVLTLYGGTAPSVTADRASFPADAESVALFRREGLLPSVENVWSLSHTPGQSLSYRLQRPNRVFEIRFDLREAVATPPPAWGAAR
jgi:hypothetical protein